MTFDVVRYLRDKRIDFFTEGYKQCNNGWVNVFCPFCNDDHSPHLGFNISDGYASCFRCGWHSLENVVQALERIKYHEACRRVIEYDSDTPTDAPITRKQADSSVPPKFPSMTSPLMTVHRNYLLRRNYDPWHLEKKYGIKATGPMSNLIIDDRLLDYSHRILIPIIKDGVMISYQGRDWTGKAILKYKACPKALEMIDHKAILYNLDNADRDTAVVVEGALDVWRLGDGSIATFGIIFTPEQIALLGRRFKRIVMVYDTEPQAQAQALKLMNIMRALGIEAFNFCLNKGDPGELSQGEANQLMREIMGR